MGRERREDQRRKAVERREEQRVAIRSCSLQYFFFVFSTINSPACRPTATHSAERSEANRTSQKTLCILSLLYLWDCSWKEQQTQTGEQWGQCGPRQYHWHPQHFEQLVSADTEATAFCHICVQTPWKGLLTCPYPFIGVQTARGILCVRESSLNSLVWPVISRPKVCWFGKNVSQPYVIAYWPPQGNKPFWRAFQSFYMNRVKGEVWDISKAEPMDLHQKGIWNHPKIFRPLKALWSFSDNILSPNPISNYFSLVTKEWGWTRQSRGTTHLLLSVIKCLCTSEWRLLDGKQCWFAQFVSFWSHDSSEEN